VWDSFKKFALRDCDKIPRLIIHRGGRHARTINNVFDYILRNRFLRVIADAPAAL
jgi:hypothetical protein